MINDVGFLLCRCYQIFMIAPIQCDQLLSAAEMGRADDIFALMAEGANIEFDDKVSSLVFGFDVLIACSCILASFYSIFLQHLVFFVFSCISFVCLIF